jgi:hypothetical protein
MAQRWLALAELPDLQVYRSILAPSSLLARATSRHLPLILSVPSGSIVHRSLAPPSQAEIWIWMPLVAELPGSFIHMPAIPDCTGLAGSIHAWSGFPVQLLIQSCTPLVVPPGSVRHRPDTGLNSWPADPSTSHCWLAPALQVNSCTLVSFAVPRLMMSRHLPWMVRVPAPPGLPSGSNVQSCEALPLHDQIWILVPFLAAPPLSSMHMPARSTCTGPETWW